MQVFKVEQWMTKDVVSVSRNTNVSDAAVMLSRHNIGCLIVTDKDEPVGILTERDIIRKVIAKGRDPKQVLAEDIMSINLVEAEYGMDIKQVSESMVRHNVKKMPVVENGKLRGIITSTDIVKIMADFNKLYDAKELMELGM